jgi:hypothetical protein
VKKIISISFWGEILIMMMTWRLGWSCWNSSSCTFWSKDTNEQVWNLTWYDDFHVQCLFAL